MQATTLPLPGQLSTSLPLEGIAFGPDQVRHFSSGSMGTIRLPLITPDASLGDQQLDDLIEECLLTSPFQEGTSFFVKEDFRLIQGHQSGLMGVEYRDGEIRRYEAAFTGLAAPVGDSWQPAQLMPAGIARYFGVIDHRLETERLVSVDDEDLLFEGLEPIGQTSCCHCYKIEKPITIAIAIATSGGTRDEEDEDEQWIETCCNEPLHQMSYTAAFYARWTALYGPVEQEAIVQPFVINRLVINADGTQTMIRWIDPFQDSY